MEKDITINDLLANNDVFADIADVNLFGGERVIAPEDLEAVPTESSTPFLKFLCKFLRIFFRVCKFRNGGVAGYAEYSGLVHSEK